MTSDVGRAETLGAASVAGRGLAATTSVVRDIHLAVSDRVFRYVGPPAAPVRLMHSGISKGVYAAVRGGVRVTSYAAGQAVAVAGDGRRREAAYLPVTDRPRAGAVVAALNGAWGDTLARWHNPLALDMTIRSGRHDVAPTSGALRAAFPDASGDVVVFLHGLCESDRSWWQGARKHHGDPSSSHGSRLAAATGATPLYLRYNTGRHVSDNGERLAALLDGVVENWPVEVERLTLVGHSMGGLVIRSACALGVVEQQPWLDRVRRCVYLGAPHLGAPLEVAANAAGLALARLAETRPIARALASRSVGIKDLRYGDVSAADWAEVADPDAWRAEPAECAELAAGIDHYYVGVTLTRTDGHPIARLIGDAFVTFPSASGGGRHRRLAFEVDRGRHLGGLHHFDLLNHPRVWELLRDWLVDGR